MEVKSSTTSPIKLKCPRGPSNTKWVSYRLVAQKNRKLFGNKSTEAWKIKLDVPSVKYNFGSKSRELDLKILGGVGASLRRGRECQGRTIFWLTSLELRLPLGNHCTRFICLFCYLAIALLRKISIFTLWTDSHNGPGDPKYPKRSIMNKIAPNGPKLPKLAQMAHNGQMAKIAQNSPSWPKWQRMAQQVQNYPNGPRLPQMAKNAPNGQRMPKKAQIGQIGQNGVVGLEWKNINIWCF